MMIPKPLNYAKIIYTYKLKCKCCTYKYELYENSYFGKIKLKDYFHKSKQIYATSYRITISKMI